MFSKASDFLVLFFLAVVASANGSCAFSGVGPDNGQTLGQSSISVNQLIDRFHGLKGKWAVVRGYFVLEPENRNLWSYAEKYGEQREPCISLEVTELLFNRREEYNRREVYAAGIVDTLGCGTSGECLSSCNRIGLREVSIIGFARPLDVLDPIPSDYGDISLLIDKHAPNYRSLQKFALRLASDIKASMKNPSSRDMLLALISRARRSAVETALAKPDSRINRLLFGEELSLGSKLEKRRQVDFNIVETERINPKEPRGSYICYCIGENCKASTLTSLRVYYRAAADPYFCIPLQLDAGRWRLEATFLLGRPAIDELD